MSARLKPWLRTVLMTFAVFLSGATSAATLNVEVVDQQGKPLNNALVFVASDKLTAGVVPLPYAEVSQQNKTFVPQITVVTKGTEVEFPNRDTVRHHVYSFSEAKTFELKLYIGKPEEPVLFDKEGVVELGCNIHDSMLGWVIVTDTPVYDSTDLSGQVSFEQLEPDQYRVRAWHPEMRYGEPPVEQPFELGSESGRVQIALEIF